jgi:hypothetical protein
MKPIMASNERNKKQKKLILTSIVFPNKSSETNALLLAESIRAFAGSLSHTPIWCFTPECGKQISATTTSRLLALNVALIPFEIDYEVLQFPFTGEIIAAALAESMVCGKIDFLAWLGANTVVLQEPKAFLLQENKNLGYRPVHHTLIGSRYDDPLDSFWTLVYRYCGVSEDRVFPMMTHVDGTQIRPYFNAGLIVTRPEKRLFQAWSDTFFRAYRERAFLEFYEKDERYKIFVHQAILSGVILSALEINEIHELPPTYNYPLHLYAQDYTDRRPSCLEELVTFRHEGFYENPKWIKDMPAKEPLKQWIAKQIL